MNRYLEILIILYTVPILRLAFFFLPPIDSKYLRKFCAIFGRYEWLVRSLRDSIVVLVLIFLVGYGIYNKLIFPALFYLGFVVLSVFSKTRFILHARRMTEFARAHPFIHPTEFFDCYYAGFGFIPIKLPHKIDKEIDPKTCSFKTGYAPKLLLWPVLVGLFNTCVIARLVVRALKWKGAEYCREVAFGVSVIWGARVAQLGNFSVETEGIEKIELLEGKCIFVFNHKSYIDFALGPFVLSHVHPQDRKRFSLRYLAARDHFLDNFFLYRLIGRAMQAFGTIFVDRKRKKYSPQLAVAEAVDKLIGLDIDIAIFPQGTRAHGNIGPRGERMDAGYYTAGIPSKLKHDGGHLKKGAAYIAVDTAIGLKGMERFAVNIIPIGIIGTATAVPRGGLRIQTETVIKAKVGDIITITKNNVKALDIGTPAYKDFVDGVHLKIDNALKEILSLHASLEKRFFTDIRRLLPSADFEYVAVAMKAWRGEDYLIYTILDCIYASRPKYWQELLREMCHVLMSDAPRESVVRFKGRVVDKMSEAR